MTKRSAALTANAPVKPGEPCREAMEFVTILMTARYNILARRAEEQRAGGDLAEAGVGIVRAEPSPSIEGVAPGNATHWVVGAGALAGAAGLIVST